MKQGNALIILILIAFFGIAMYPPHTITPHVISYPRNWPKPTYDFSKNPLTKEGIQLGRKLFYDPILSKDSSTSCSNCHLSFTAFTHVDHALSHGVNDSIGTRNSLALMNLAWQPFFMWDGAINHLDLQALAPINHPAEMAENINNVIQKIRRNTRYKNLFYAAFKDSTVTGEHLLKAISQFELTLISANSKYDSVMRKSATFTPQEANGYKIYQKNCAACHTEPFFTNFQFENNGLSVDTNLNDYGRYRITQMVSDSLKFKVPTLRNIEFSYPYMHDGRFKNISEVLKHYSKDVNFSKTLSKQLKHPINMNSNEKVDLTAFLLTLSDKHFLFNKDHAFPVESIHSIKKEK